MQVARMVNRLTASGIAVLLIAGSAVVWLGIPAGCIWLSSKTARSVSDSFAILLGVCPVAMVAFSLVLVKLNGVYLRLRGAHPSQHHSAWLKSLSGERTIRTARPVLETSMIASALIALVALFVWFFFFAHSHLPAGPV